MDPEVPDQMQEAIVAAGRLATAMDVLSKKLESLQLFGKRNRTFIRILAVSVALDLLLSFGLIVSVDRANAAAAAAKRASSAAAVSKEANFQTCVSSNAARLVQVQLWDYVLNLPPSPDRAATPEQQAQVEQFRIYVHTAFAQRECQR